MSAVRCDACGRFLSWRRGVAIHGGNHTGPYLHRGRLTHLSIDCQLKSALAGLNRTGEDA